MGNICPICPTCTISVSPKWGCADRGAVTKPPLRDFSPLSFLPNILQTDKLVNKASSFEPSQQKKYSTFQERIWVPSSLRQRLQQQLSPGRAAAPCARSPERFNETATISINLRKLWLILRKSSSPGWRQPRKGEMGLNGCCLPGSSWTDKDVT